MDCGQVASSSSSLYAQDELNKKLMRKDHTSFTAGIALQDIDCKAKPPLGAFVFDSHGCPHVLGPTGRNKGVFGLEFSNVMTTFPAHVCGGQWLIFSVTANSTRSTSWVTEDQKPSPRHRW